MSRLYCGQTASSCLQNTPPPQELGGYKRKCPASRRPEGFIFQAGDRAPNSLALDISSMSIGPLFCFHNAEFSKYWLHE